MNEVISIIIVKESARKIMLEPRPTEGSVMLTNGSKIHHQIFKENEKTESPKTSRDS